ncbi:lysophospholipid acyltransferase family protein [Limisalsivibrio acetivorans]|uniref:lysophospholipid acyltransferase family protein n=1 Tax=Limisalsivibrio acetivorans TaxID=1304888 RepID=UPI0003B4B5D2|nr:lysophospholipid acyltransferase family protein [Limisalsivibrio acetivorans]
MRRVYSFFFWIFLGLFTAMLVIVGYPKSKLTKDPHAYKKLSAVWAGGLMRMLGIKLDVEGLEKLDRNEHYVFMGNHISYVDIFVMLNLFKDRPFLFMAKKELFSIPFFGYAIRHIGMIPIEREDKKDGIKSLLTAAKKISEGYSVLLFPEGTRSEDGQLGNFKRGAFLLANRTGNRIAPFILRGTNEAMPKKGWLVKPFVNVHLKFMDPINPEGMKDKELMQTVREAMLEELGQSDSTRTGEQSGEQGA